MINTPRTFHVKNMICAEAMTVLQNFTSPLDTCWVTPVVGYMLGYSRCWIHVGLLSLLDTCWVTSVIGYMLGYSRYWIHVGLLPLLEIN